MFGASASVDFYDKIIAPYKGSLEEWFVSNKGIYIYFLAIFTTAWVVVFPTQISRGGCLGICQNTSRAKTGFKIHRLI